MSSTASDSHDHSQSEQPTRKPRRTYRDYPSNNKFFCHGRLISGPDARYVVTTLFCIFAPISLYFSTVVVYFIREIELGYILIPFEALLLIFMCSALLKTSCVDPGIIPRQRAPSGDAFNLPAPYKTIQITCRGASIDYQCKYCDTCNLYRPVRAVHCGACNSCIEKFDHHCPWIGNCIGARNYKYFIMFLFAALLNTVYVQLTSLTELLYRVHLSEFRLAVRNPSSLIIVIYCTVCELVILTLLGYHLRLIYLGVTTNEQLKGTFQKGNPYSRGFFWNITDVCCSSTPPTYVLWREKNATTDAYSNKSQEV
ncbi:palmitoyltransferase ZDHHC18-like isoform X1 [Schistocerca gregaria]|uniref:palmitoyltransferase ZDHHC18-like isoform X1 n=1 Tax=Schistocerca gregaria TaxID=7010 RepID=UPI00211DC313|nr:palmitoyltransferase ZDHHC18-like isoform X1 [Schistocerca gregaria]